MAGDVLAVLQDTHARPQWLLETLLHEQQTLTAVEHFARLHDDGNLPAAARYYRDLIPSSLPGSGQQYAFEVDLDACSGCKACVVACHNLNGLEEHELWRSVGLLVGGAAELPVLQHVTTACHHCVEPACLEGCPVEAYEKDPVTGIVRHLDDQCIGCQYCMLKCPYDVPVYSRSKGIVRKCDMCSQRLAVGEAPACVQSCPNQAIGIRIVSQQAIREESETPHFLPGAPEPGYTLPATRYKSRRVLPRNTLPADYFLVRRGHAHLALVVMLVLTQMSVGAFVVEQLMVWSLTSVGGEMAGAVRHLHLVAALLLGLLGLGAAVFHLGRPRYAYRALLGLRTSWLSREILAFGLFAALASLYVGAACGEHLGFLVTQRVQHWLGALASLTGVVGIGCSVMIYVDTRRPLWTPGRTSAMFFLTALLLGLPVALLVALAAAGVADHLTTATVMRQIGRGVYQALIAVATVKLALEAGIFLHLRDAQYTPRRRTALLLRGELASTATKRYLFGAAGGIGLPLLLLAEPAMAPQGYHPLLVGVATLLVFGLLAAGELLERYLFFTASVAAKMPGAAAA